jgi:hypothetical protein
MTAKGRASRQIARIQRIVAIIAGLGWVTRTVRRRGEQSFDDFVKAIRQMKAKPCAGAIAAMAQRNI